MINDQHIDFLIVGETVPSWLVENTFGLFDCSPSPLQNFAMLTSGK